MLPILSNVGSITLTQLTYAVAVDTHRHFGRAAEACNVTQPTLSMQLSKLESTLGVILFDRSKSPVITTDLGRDIIDQAAVVLREAARITDIRNSFGGQVIGELRLGIIPTLAPSLLPRLIPALSSEYPNISLTVVEEKTEDIVESLNKELIDVGIVASSIDGLNEQLLFNEPFVGYISPNHRLSCNNRIDVTDLSLDDLWLLSEGHCFRAQTVALCNERGDSRRSNKDLPKSTQSSVLFESGHLDTLIRLVERGMGMTLLPALAAYDLPQDVQARFVRRFIDPAPSRLVRLVRSRRHIKDRLVQAMEDVLRSQLPPEIEQL